MNLLQLQEHSPKRVRAKTFFEHVCPTLMAERADLCRQLGGSYTFRLGGAGGGTWTLDFFALKVEARARHADLSVTMLVEDFEALMAGTLDVAGAMERGALAFEGDGGYFEKLAQFTRPGLNNRWGADPSGRRSHGVLTRGSGV